MLVGNDMNEIREPQQSPRSAVLDALGFALTFAALIAVIFILALTLQN